MGFAFAACSPSVKVVEPVEMPTAELSAIDSLMWRQPDSALALLLEFADSPKADSLDEFNGHYCQMLVSELLYKNDWGQSNRGELLKAVGYFDSIVDLHGVDIQKRNAFLDARAHYINGVGFYERDSIVEACAEYLKALEVMEENFHDQALSGIRVVFVFYTYNRLLELFSAQFMMASAIKCGEEAFAYCQKEPSLSKEIPNTYFHIGKQYDKMGEKNTARDYYCRAIEGLSDINNLVYRDAVSMKALCDYQVGHDVDSSISLIRHVHAFANSEKEKLTRFMTIGGIFTIEKSYDSALYYLIPVFENKDDISIQMQAAEYLLINYNNLGNEDKANECIGFLGDHKKPEGEDKALVSKLEGMFQQHLQWKQEKAEAERWEAAILRRIKIIVVTVVFVAVAVLMAWLFHRRKMRQQRDKASQQIEAERAAHRLEKASMSGRLKRSNEELRELKDQIKQQNEDSSSKGETQAATFMDEPICRLIMERVRKGQFKSQMDYTLYKDYALSKEQLIALREAANRHYDHFIVRLVQTYPDITKSDLDYCCLYLLDLTDADISALMQRAYNTVNERNSKLKKILGCQNTISVALHAFADGRALY